MRSIEEQADQIEEQALNNARDIVASAGKDAAAVADKADEQAELEAKEVIKAKKEEAFLKISEIKSDTESKCAEIKEKANKKLDAAADYIAERVVKLNDR